MGRPRNSRMKEVTTEMREREREGGNWRLGMGRPRGVEKKNKFTLGTERCENSNNRFIKK